MMRSDLKKGVRRYNANMISKMPRRELDRGRVGVRVFFILRMALAVF